MPGLAALTKAQASVANDQEAREATASALEAEIDLHQAGAFDDLGLRYDDLYTRLLPLVETELPPFSIVLRFIDGWGDASRHDWKYYDGIARDEWPTHARRLATALRSHQTIMDPVLLRHFGP